MRYSATNFSKNGISDWLSQRVSAYILGAYFVVVLGFLLCQGPVSYNQWVDFMTCTPMQYFTLVSLFALAAHAWVGVWTVLTDYVTERQMGAKATFLRMAAVSAMVIFIFVLLVWGIQILWGN